MTENTNRPTTTPESEAPLESWKEIANYLNRTVRTVRRWEKEEKLPVHRHLHQAGSSVYAYPGELEAWKAAREPGFDSAPPVPPWRRPALGLTFALLLALVTFASGPLLTPPNALAQDTDGMTVRRVWAGPEVDVLGGPSPDGRYLSYVDWETGDLAVRDLKTAKNRHLTNKGSWFESTEYAEFSTMSPDGKQVAYAWFNEDFFYDLRIVGLEGSDPRVLYSNEEVEYLQPATWSPDGKHVLATFFRKGRTNQIVLVSVADGSVRVLKTLDWRWPEKMSLSPDGRYIAYDFPPQEDSPKRDIFLLASGGSRETPLIEHPANDRLPVWTPDGKKILFGSDRTGTNGAWVIQVANGKPQGSPELVKPDMGRRILPMGFTKKGSYYYGLQTGMNDVYTATLDLKTGKLLGPPTKATQRFVGSNSSPDWSPDGQSLAYISQRGPSPGLGSKIISIRSLKTGEEHEISPKLNYIFNRLRWSPDGRSLLVTGRDKKGRQGIYQIDAQTSNVTPIVQSDLGVYGPEWSADGRGIFYRRSESSTKKTSIVVRDLGTGGEKELYGAFGSSFLGYNLPLSPDGGQLAFTINDQATRSSILKVMPAAGGEARELLRLKEPESIGLLVWTPDGQEVIFGKNRSTSLEEQTPELWRISAQGGETQRLVELEMEQLRGLRFHPDGRRIAFSGGKFSGEVWVMENFLPKASTETARLEE